VQWIGGRFGGLEMILAITMNPAIDKVYAIDDFAVNQVFRPKAMTATAGGKGLNVARVAHILGEPVMATGFLGGSTGQLIHQQVVEMGIVSSFVFIQGETRICINIMDEKNTTSTEVLEPGPVVTGKDSKLFLQQYEKMLDECAVVTASGSLPKGMPSDFYCTLIEITRSKGKSFILDTSGDCLKQSIQAKPYMIKPNQEEFENALGSHYSSLREYGTALLALKDQGISLPVITFGKDGCIAALDDGVYHFSAPPIKVLNTVGSGDSFTAGCAVSLSRGEASEEIIRLGMACGMANTQFFKTGMVSVELVKGFLQTINTEKII
jgi:tagatose 6-phosphate kinase